ncbi:M23 family metallopeptidase [Actinokineospora xionganensis]|uniref:M23 family metallopeptidase n=1 Tax=Actinokineospora xionganensis TaxID=2684470 RepID=A0ABR7LEB4_9PSEU|nr:M23 family metallopeptidase [Actinokineospora xionganensis]MBC6451063.1 M23 family metallopeptidase [Actinokineospora xionganensis]
MSPISKVPQAVLVSVTSLALTLGAATAVVASADPRPAGDSLDASLDSSVAAAMTAERGGAAQAYFQSDSVPRPLVEPKRSDAAGEWAFGTAVIPIPGDARQKHGSPEAGIFLARLDGRTWQVAFDGSPEFRALAAKAPESVLSADERNLFTQSPADSAAAATATGLALPWSQGSIWPMGGGPHGYSGSTRPFSSLDFGGSGSVRSAGPGKVYKSCVKNGSALVTVVHNNGYRTSYYHMTNLTNLADGASVDTGTYLGATGTALPCGGSANGAHVHFSLLSGTSYVSVHGKTIGGWTFYEGSQAYRGYAERNGTKVYPGGRLTNYGVS